MKTGFIIVAGGSGSRAGQSLPKQYQSLAGKPVLAWSVEACLRHQSCAAIVIVHPIGDGQRIASILHDAQLDHSTIRMTDGGLTRTDSVRAGLAQLVDQDLDAILVHDAARPGIDHGVIDRLLSALKASPAAVPVVGLADALWRLGGAQLIQAEDRDTFGRVQTPQAARADDLRAAYAKLPMGATLPDDAAVLQAAGHTIATVAGSHRLDKITFAEDFARVEALLTDQNKAAQSPLIPHVGTGFDAHRFSPGAELYLCGVKIDHHSGLAGHSDADVGWHALCDAIYGALSEGDIGKAFPPSDPQWKGAASSVFLKHAGSRIAARGGRLAHCDVTLICEAPRIGPHRDAMIAKTAEILGVGAHRVSIKATTTEAMGFTGRGEGIAALASATVLLPDYDDVS